MHRQQEIMRRHQAATQMAAIAPSPGACISGFDPRGALSAASFDRFSLVLTVSRRFSLVLAVSDRLAPSFCRA